MKLVPVMPGEEVRYERRQPLPEGSVQITPEQQQLIGVEYGTVDYENVSGALRAVARVTIDETKVAKVNSKLEGWLEQVFVDSVGGQVKKGDPLVTIYSPEALATQQEYLLAIKGQTMMHDSPVHEMLGSTDNLVAAAKKRLELWDITDRQIAAITETGRPVQYLTLYAPASGFVMERNAYAEGESLPETVLYNITDLSSVWVMADVFEHEASNVRIGQSVALTLAYLPGRTFRGRVSYILPAIDPATRTVKVRIEFHNPEFLLKPEMYGEVEFQTGGSRRLVVPGPRCSIRAIRRFRGPQQRLLRTARRQDRAQNGGRTENLERAEGRRAHRHLRQLRSIPKATENRAGRGFEMIISIHRVLRAQPLPGVPVRGRIGAGGLLVDAADSAGRNPRLERHAGDRLFALGPQPGHSGGPGHLPDCQRHARSAESEGCARLQRFRLLVRLHHF